MLLPAPLLMWTRMMTAQHQHQMWQHQPPHRPHVQFYQSTWYITSPHYSRSPPGESTDRSDVQRCVWVIRYVPLRDNDADVRTTFMGLALLTLSFDKKWDSHSPKNGYPSFYPRKALVAPSPGLPPCERWHRRNLAAIHHGSAAWLWCMSDQG